MTYKDPCITYIYPAILNLIGFKVPIVASRNTRYLFHELNYLKQTMEKTQEPF